MVLILSDKEDYTTSKVIKWLIHFGQKYRRINGGEKSQLCDLRLGEQFSSQLHFQGYAVDLELITGFWYRRGKIEVVSAKTRKQEAPVIDALEPYLKQELKTIDTYWHETLRNKKAIGSYEKNSLNKLLSLQAAQACGLQIPDTLVTGNKEKLKHFLAQYPDTICKPIFEVPRVDKRYGRVGVRLKMLRCFGLTIVLSVRSK